MKTGLDRVLEDPSRWFDRERVALIANPSTVNRRFQHALQLFRDGPEPCLTAVLAPEHGLEATLQYMVPNSQEQVNPASNIRVFDVYGEDFESLSPPKEVKDIADTLVFDVQDVGTRYYTYAATMALAMKFAAQNRRRMVVLDRPNPIGGTFIEGGGINPGLESFVGLYPVPNRHGCTVGELAKLYNDYFEIGCELTVVTCEGWRRAQWHDETDAPWVMPSPNMPTIDTALVYPGMCLLEGTNISEGRGTTRPFELFGAPFIDANKLKNLLESLELKGVCWRTAGFVPTFDKFVGETCQGIQIHVIDRLKLQPYQVGLAVVWATHQLYPSAFTWRTTPYEFRDDVPAFDLLTGRPQVRTLIDAGAPFADVYKEACSGAEFYNDARADCLLYD